MVLKHISICTSTRSISSKKSYLCTNFIDDYFDGTSLTKDKGTPLMKI